MMTRRLAVLLFVLVASVAAAVPATASAGMWHETTLGLCCYPGFNGVGASSATNVWAVGENDAVGERPYAEHWDGSSWTQVPVPAPGGPTGVADGGLDGVSVLSAKNAWAVGWADLNVTRFAPLVEHWNGTAWSVKATPAVPDGSSLQDVAAITRRNVWAVGRLPAGPLVEHYNGRAWRRVAVPGAGYLESVKAVSASSVWAVGGAGEIAHYNGRRWRLVSFPGESTNVTLYQVNRISKTRRMWAVGEDLTTVPASPVALYYNGSHWRSTHPPGQATLFGVAAISRRNVWAAGSLASGDPYALHWNGVRWSVVSGTALSDGYVSHMTRAPGSRILWAVGRGGAGSANPGHSWAVYHG
jgi:hypothetical protein